LLEAMQERQVTIGGQTFPLPEPFIALATQNPIEQEGTYPLPEAQVDRFMLKLKIEYPTREEETQIVNRMATGSIPEVKVAATGEDIAAAIKVIEQIYIDPKIIEYIVNVVEAGRRPEKYGLQIAHLIQYGASPRASIFLTKAARARAFLQRRGYVTPDDVKTAGMDVLRHRIIPTYEADAENYTSEDIIKTIFDNLEVP
ncbi:MAG: MoxR family ATPase, partial [Nitrospinota bacterium]|nr:MoxR family ATPase [Nitrospinota bacterium]